MAGCLVPPPISYLCTMKQEECYEFGIIAKTHGLKGEVAIKLDVDDPAEYADIESMFVEMKGQLVPYFVESSRFHQDRLIVKFEEVDTLEAATRLKGNLLFLPLESLPELEEGQFYFHEVIGYELADPKLGTLGKIEQVYTATAQPLFAITYKGKEVLVPMSDELLVGINHEAKTLEITVPEGLIDLYLED